jgi:hypothetical protein
MGLLLLFPRVLAAGRTRYWCSARRVEDAGEIVSRKDEMFHTHPIANRKRGPLSDPAVPTKGSNGQTTCERRSIAVIVEYQDTPITTAVDAFVITRRRRRRCRRRRPTTA